MDNRICGQQTIVLEDSNLGDVEDIRGELLMCPMILQANSVNFWATTNGMPHWWTKDFV